MKWITDRYPTQDELQVKDHGVRVGTFLVTDGKDIWIGHFFMLPTRDGSYRVGYWEDAHERVKAWMPLPALPEGELPR